ncbi:copper amine oxidase N-terminal domain-containing protein [Sporanaerobium hydrogeniformans]|uniref:copper amine oxidase N-terminal domain-containing protein n=1 Tax=Sporanaerobium hydrogeniformans TaxID=3072179 RepID=UPI0015D4CEBF|nr:copper amine oxidase N-terminal domain-containing protein [Sporanaerobium hydrogeniformans]
MGRKIYQNILCRIVLISSCLFISQGTVAKTIEPGNPVGSYDRESIRLEDGTTRNVVEGQPVLFINGTCVAEDEVIIRNGRALVPLRVISEVLGYDVSWDQPTQTVHISQGDKQIILTINQKEAMINNQVTQLDQMPILYKERTYVPIRFIGENFDAHITYGKPLKEPFTYYYNTQMPITPTNTLIRAFPNILVDTKMSDETISKEEALKKTKEVCYTGLIHFAEKMRANLESSGEESNRFDEEFKGIEKEIERMMYLGEVSRYYQFTIGAYDILFDKYNGNLFFVMYSSGIKVKKVDVNDPYLFLSVFIVG